MVGRDPARGFPVVPRGGGPIVQARGPAGLMMGLAPEEIDELREMGKGESGDQ
jgi:hypothetical protein